jgi:hypothetical protein
MVLPGDVGAQPPGFNYDEAKVPSYALPDPLRLQGGARVVDAKTWQEKRRPELLRLFETHVYGRSAGPPTHLTFETRSVDPHALQGKATRTQIAVLFDGRADGPQMDLLLYVPNTAAGRVPVVLGLNFHGNHAVHADPGILLSRRWMPERAPGVVDHRATEAARGSDSGPWAIEAILDAGFAFATVYCGDLEPDTPEGWKEGVRAHFGPGARGGTFAADDWGTIGAWAWGLSRALDVLEKTTVLDGKRVVVMGHSRLGKAALWAGAQDERFALVVSNESGEGGAALSRRRFGETVARINTSFPHWFCANYKRYNDREDDLPVDQHLLVALVAPRPVYVASAAEDLWADPRGEFLSAKNAEPVYRLFGKDGLGVDQQPAVGQAVGASIGYHVRAGAHDVTRFDWDQYLRFARRHLIVAP